ncbi:MAG: undecaprenyl-diphosphate phosphatase [Clostridia bacterium]|nr:undecaprenyl-diphosphate phosphatase [Clostridia bacterium]
MLVEIIKTIILGIVQGITEWLPVSSTGHLILVEQFMSLNQDRDFMNLFFVIVQFGSILAVVTMYFHKLNPFSPKKTAAEKIETWNMWLKVIVGIIPAGVIGFLFEDAIDKYCYNSMVVAAALIIYGVAFIIIEKRSRKPLVTSIDTMTYKTAFLIGVFQVLALIPGTSRSGSTILGGVIMGASRFVAAEFSFFMAVPTMLGASAVKLLKYFKDGLTLNSEQIIVLITGMAVAYIVSVAAIKFLMEYIKKHDFCAFGYYRIIVGIIVLVYFAVTGATIIA